MNNWTYIRVITMTLNDQNHILENCIGSVINFFILTQVPFVYMERVGFMTCTAASHQGAIKEPAASLFLTCEAHPVFSTVPPSGQEIWKMAIFAYNFSMVWPKITKLVSLGSVHHARVKPYPMFPMSAILCVGYFEFCSQMLYLRTHWRIVTKLVWFISTMPWSSVRSFEQAPPSGKSNIHMLITLGVVDLFSQESPF